jgi:serine/threonine protein kinase
MSVPEVIGEGAYGCVHKPSLLCKNKNISYKNKISKIMLSKEAVKELKEYALISRIDKNNEYYVGMPTTCSVKNTTQAIKAVNKCKNIKKKYFRRGTVKQGLSKMSLLVMSDGGKDLKAMGSYFDKLSDTSDTVKKVKEFWVEIHRLFRGLLTFQKYGIVHHDVKPQNLVYNISTNRVNYIDFGHMRNIKHELEKCDRSDNWIYDYPFWNYPFEIQFLNRGEYMHFVNKSKKEKEQFIIEFIDDLKKDRDTKFTTAFRIFMDYMLRGRSKADEKILCDRYIMDFKKTVLEHMKIYDEFAKRSIESIDIYGLGMSLQFVLAYTKRFMESGIVKELEECFFRMTTANLMERYTAEEAVDAFESALEIAGYAAFEKNAPILKQNSQTTEKSLKNIDTADISIRKLSKDQLRRAMNRF